MEQTQVVNLNPNTSQVVSFKVTPATVGTYQVAVNGLTGSFYCVEEPNTPYLTMTKTELYQQLINGNVARDWWNMDYTTRRALAVKIAQKWSNDYFCRYAYGIAVGGPEGQNPPTHNGRTEPGKNLWGRSGYGMEFASSYRYILLSDIAKSEVPNTLYWWKYQGTAIDSENSEMSVWKCYEPGVRFSLPMAVATGDADWFNCIQVDSNVASLKSWVFFQLWITDGYPGCDSQLWHATSGYVRVCNVKGFESYGATQLGDLIAEIRY
jgi:hypothetical protein